MAIDKDCVEKREIAAMSNYHAALQAKKGGGGARRLSWTGLATMAAACGGQPSQHQSNGMNAGMVALEVASKGLSQLRRPPRLRGLLAGQIRRHGGEHEAAGRWAAESVRFGFLTKGECIAEF